MQDSWSKTCSNSKSRESTSSSNKTSDDTACKHVRGVDFPLQHTGIAKKGSPAWIEGFRIYDFLSLASAEFIPKKINSPCCARTSANLWWMSKNCYFQAEADTGRFDTGVMYWRVLYWIQSKYRHTCSEAVHAIEDCKDGANDWATRGKHFFVDETDPVVHKRRGPYDSHFPPTPACWIKKKGKKHPSIQHRAALVESVMGVRSL